MAKLTQHQFEKSQEIFADITRIDGLLEKLNDRATELMNNEGYFSKIQLSFESDASREEMPKASGIAGMFIDHMMEEGLMKAKKEEVMGITIDEGVAYEIISSIIKTKTDIRRKMVKDLAEMGIEI
jgi:hypothetical protein